MQVAPPQQQAYTQPRVQHADHDATNKTKVQQHEEASPRAATRQRPQPQAPPVRKVWTQRREAERQRPPLPTVGEAEEVANGALPVRCDLMGGKIM